MAKIKTSSYQLRASANYKKKHDQLQVALDLGERDKLREVGIDNTVIRELIREEYRKRTEGEK